MENTKRRLFIAIPVSGEVAETIAELLKSLSLEAEGMGLSVAWVSRRNLHITLRFLGWVDESQIAEIQKRLAALVTRYASFSVHLRGLGMFPNESLARVLWAGVQEVAEGLSLRKLSHSITEELAPLGFEKDPLPYTPHLTLARLKKGGIGELIHPHRFRTFGALDVREVILYESIPGSDYQILERYDFKKFL